MKPTCQPKTDQIRVFQASWLVEVYFNHKIRLDIAWNKVEINLNTNSQKYKF